MSKKRAVIVICDGLRADMATPSLCPKINSLRDEGCWFEKHHAVFPSVTRVSSAVMATGCRPGVHGLHGNTMALDEGRGLEVHDVGCPDFRFRMRRATGRTLQKPTLAEILAPYGGSVVFSNVSPGAAYFQDPDGFGYVYHRAGSFGPGIQPVPPGDHLDVTHDKSGDMAMTERFCHEILLKRGPALSVLWLCEPDFTGHHFPLGSPEHLEAIGSADDCAAMVIETVGDMERRGDDVLLLVGSDHGQETVGNNIALDRALVEADLKKTLESNDVLVAPQGTGALIYAEGRCRDRLGLLLDFFLDQPWCGEVYGGVKLVEVGLKAAGGLIAAVSMTKNKEVNEFGIPGCSDYGVVSGGEEKSGVGQHGGLGGFEQHPFLVVRGRGFPPGSRRRESTCLPDMAPTILLHFERSPNGMDGRPLQGAGH